MATPYQTDERITTTATNEVVAIPFPSRCEITKIAISSDQAAPTVNFYNRAFTMDPVDIKRMYQNDDGDLQIEFDESNGDRFEQVRVGDQVFVDGTSVGGYNSTQHVVTEVIDAFNIVVATAYSADATGGTCELTIVSGEQNLYRVVPPLTLSSNIIEYYPDSNGEDGLFINRDVVGNSNTGLNRFIYARFSAIGTYRVVITSNLSVD